MKQLIGRIKQYKPVDEQEQIDQRLIISYNDMFDDLLTRNNGVCHFTSSGFILNTTRSKVLMVQHNIFNTYSLVGGHLDGDADCLRVAHNEILEETSLTQVDILSPNIISLDILPVIGHYKRSTYVNPHLHLSICYLFIAEEQSALRPKHDENSAVAWLPLHSLSTYIDEAHMLRVYDKIKEKVLLL